MKGNQALTHTLANISLMKFFTDRLFPLYTHSLNMWASWWSHAEWGANNDDINIMHVLGSLIDYS